MATRKAGITAIKRVIEDELRKRIAKENEARKANWPELSEAITTWALNNSPLGAICVKGMKAVVKHEFLRMSAGEIHYNVPNVEHVTVLLEHDGSGIRGSLTHELKLPKALLTLVNRSKEITFHSFQQEAELLASRVLLRAEDGDLEEIIADVVNEFLKEKTKE